MSKRSSKNSISSSGSVKVGDDEGQDNAAYVQDEDLKPYQHDNVPKSLKAEEDGTKNNNDVWALYNSMTEDNDQNLSQTVDVKDQDKSSSTSVGEEEDDQDKSSSTSVGEEEDDQDKSSSTSVGEEEDDQSLSKSVDKEEDDQDPSNAVYMKEQDQNPPKAIDEEFKAYPPPQYSSVPPLSTNPDIKDSDHLNDAEYGTIKTVGVVDHMAPAEGAEEEEGGRDLWDSQLEFLLSCISMSVGLGNVWRFPFTAYENGGGAFLIPYLIVLLLIGRPIYYLEMCLGQFTSFGQTKVWAMAPLFKGVAYGATLGVICVVSYYCSLMALTTFYFFASFAKTVPWDDCKTKWNFQPEFNGTEWVNMTYCDEDGTYIGPNTTSISQLYYEKEVFPQKKDISDGLGYPEWRMTLCLAFAWIVVLGSLIKGVKSSGKVAYFTAIFPYVVLFILLIRGVTLPGAWEGIKFFLTPQWDKIYKPQVWFAAVGQCFFSLATGFGPIIMFSSYNPFRHNVNRDALIISLMDTFTSLLAGLTIFSVLGNLAHEMGGVPIDTVAKGGPGLAFISYPEAIAKFDWVPQLFAVLFFLMLFTLGIGSATSLTGGVITIICDQFPKLIRWQVTTAVCVGGFLIGLLYVTPGGHFMLTLVDTFGANFVIYVMAMVEVGAISYVYGLNNFCSDIEFMLGTRPGWYWKACWGFFIPVGLFAILVYWAATNEQLTHEGMSYPSSAIISGWILGAVCLSMLPLWGLHGILSRKAPTFKEKFFESLRPTKHWGPKYAKERLAWIEFKKNR